MFLISHPFNEAHQVPDEHAERPERTRSLNAFLDQHFVDPEQHTRLEAHAAQRDQILLAHPDAHISYLEGSVPQDGIVPVDPDTWLSPNSLVAATHAAGAVCEGVDHLLQGTTQHVFCPVRPPGHHAEINAAMGFCLYNSIAIGALHALQQDEIQRVAILDFDVHHGNGTVDIFKDDPRVLVCSSFQHPYYPNRLFDVARDHVIHTPLEAGTSGQRFRRLVEQQWQPALHAHQPDLILISAGFDAHEQDPLANLMFRSCDYHWFAQWLVDQAAGTAQGRILSALEGGYDLQALNHCVLAWLQGLSGRSLDIDERF